MTTMETKWSMFKAFGAPSGRSMLTSVALHVPVLVVLMLLPAQALLRSTAKKEIDVVALHEKGNDDHEDDQQHEHHVNERRDVDLGLQT